MVGCRFFGLEMIPDDRGRSAQGPPRVFGPKIPIFALPGGPGPRSVADLCCIFVACGPIQTAGPFIHNYRIPTEGVHLYSVV